MKITMTPKFYVYAMENGVPTVTEVIIPRPPKQLPLFTLPPPPTVRTWSIEWRWSPETVKEFTERSPEWQAWSTFSTAAQARNTIRRLRHATARARVRLAPNKNYRIRQTSVHHHGDIECHIPDYPCPVRRALDGSPVSGWAKPTLVPLVMPVTSPFPPNTPFVNPDASPIANAMFSPEMLAKMKKAMGVPSSSVAPTPLHNQSIPWGEPQPDATVVQGAPPEGWQSPTPWLVEPEKWESPFVKPSVGLPPVVSSADGSTQTVTFPVVAIPAAGLASWAGSPHLLPPMDVPVDDFVAQFAKAFTADFPEAIEKLKGDITAAAAAAAAEPTGVAAVLNTAAKPGDYDYDW